MTTLALDLGTSVGFALSTDPFIYGTRKLKHDRFSGAGMRYLDFQRWLVATHLQYGLTHVVFEEVHRHSAVAAAHVYGGLAAILFAFCESNAIPYRGYGVGTIKRFATGSGSAGKDAMIAAAVALGFAPPDDNAADAIHLLRLSLSGA